MDIPYYFLEGVSIICDECSRVDLEISTISKRKTAEMLKI